MLMAVQVNVNSVNYETARCGNEKVTLAGMNIVCHDPPQLTSRSQTSVSRWCECTLIVMVVKAAYERILSVIGAKALTYAIGHARKKRKRNCGAVSNSYGSFRTNTRLKKFLLNSGALMYR